jgi:(2Fe-2S) ferredoxin
MFRADSGCLTMCAAGPGWAVAGGGLFQIYHFVAAEALLQGKLIEVMTFAGRSRPFYALYPQHRHLSARVRAFVDYLLAAVRPEGSPVPGNIPPSLTRALICVPAPPIPGAKSRWHSGHNGCLIK